MHPSPRRPRQPPCVGLKKTSNGLSHEDERARVVYISYDGIGEPLGQSQVLPYLSRLTSDYDITLVSFEKSYERQAVLAAEISRYGIRWIPLRYHRRPPALSTARDVLAGTHALRKVSRSGKPSIVHVRSDVPALIALSASRATGARLLFDIRGFWADERVDGGLWRPNGVLYRVAKRLESRFFQEADAIVTLTQASVPIIQSWTRGRSVPIDVIPTCVDLRRFSDRPARPGGPHAVWTGSVGTWYRFDLAPKVAAALALPLTVITRQTELARDQSLGYPASVRSVEPDQVPMQLFAGDIGLCLIKSSFSKIASAPTRFAEYLAAGMPVLVTPGVGDLEAIVTDNRVGTVMRGEDAASIAAAASSIRALAQDPATAERCRLVASDIFDVDAGSARYRNIYRHLETA